MIKTILWSAVVAASILSIATSAAAQSTGAAGSVDVVKVLPTFDQGRPSRSLKFLCGTIAPDTLNTEFPAEGQELLVPGTYLTIANLLNRFPRIGRFTGHFISDQDNVAFDFLALPLQEIKFDCETFLTQLSLGSGNTPRESLKSEFFLGYLLVLSRSTEVTGIYGFKNVEKTLVQPNPGPIDPAN